MVQNHAHALRRFRPDFCVKQPAILCKVSWPSKFTEEPRGYSVSNGFIQNPAETISSLQIKLNLHL
jgi:hypothetical protein